MTFAEFLAPTALRGITVYQLKSTWAYRITGEPETISGSRIRPYKGGFTTEEEAWRAAVDAKKRLESGRTPHAKNISVTEYFAEWLQTVKANLKDTTAESYSDMISAYIDPSMGSRRLGDLKVPTLHAFYRELRVALFRNTAIAFPTSGLTIQVSFTQWGWLHIIAGALVFAVGLGLFTGRTWARVLGVIVVSISAMVNFAWAESYPVWSITLLAD